MKNAPLVAAYGHLFRNLDIETDVLARSNIKLIDANKLAEAEIEHLDVRGVLLGAFQKIDRKRIQNLPHCKAIVRYGIGVDNVDLQAAKQAGIIVCNVPDYCVEEVAVHALACSLTLMRALNYWDQSVRSGEWRGKRSPALRRPSTCCLGIIGFGQIGKALESRARAIFGSIKIYDPWYKTGDNYTIGSNSNVVVDFDDLLQQSDVVSVHVPLTSATLDMLDQSALRKMKPGAFVINASRGGIVNVVALLESIHKGHIAGAALDTFSKEPLPVDDELIGERRVLLSPHIAWKSDEAESALQRGAAEEMVRILTGGRPNSQIES